MSENQNGSATAGVGAPPSIVPASAGQPEMRVSASDLKRTYCNVCSATSTSEEVVLSFGFNSNWDMREQPMEITLQHRIVMSPKAAKRFHGVLTKLLAEHEARNGSLG